MLPDHTPGLKIPDKRQKQPMGVETVPGKNSMERNFKACEEN